MKNSIKIFILIALVSVPAAIQAQGDPQGKHAINTKGAGANDKVALAPCPAVAQSVITAAQERLKTRTKSNNANERTAAPAVRVIQAGCSDARAVDPEQAISFTWKIRDWIKPSFDNAHYRIKVWQLMEGQTGANGMTAENIVMEKTVAANAEYLDLDQLPRRPRDVSTSFVWEVQAMEATGKAADVPPIRTYDLVLLKK